MKIEFVFRNENNLSCPVLNYEIICLKFVLNLKTNVAELKIAGQTTEFVNKVLDKVKSGVHNGGLDDL